MSYMRMSGSLSGSRLATKDDFCASSQIAAMRPVLNSTQGPTLYLISEYPYPKYKSVYPIQLNHGETKNVTVTFLSKDGSGFISRLTPVGPITGYCAPVLKRLDLEVWAADITITGNLPYGTDLASANTILTLTNAGVVTEVALELSVIRVPPLTVQMPTYTPAFAAPLVASKGPGVTFGSTPIHRSLGGSGYAPVSRSQIYSPYVPPVNQATLPSSVTYNSRYSDVNPGTPGRYHSDYVYNPALPVPQIYQNEIKQSILEASLRGSQFGTNSGTQTFVPQQNVTTAPYSAPESQPYQPTTVQPQQNQVTQQNVQNNAQPNQHMTMTTAAATIADPNAPVLKSPRGSGKSDTKTDKQATSQLNEKMLEPEDVGDVKDGGDASAAVEEDEEIVGTVSDSIQVLPQSIIFRPCEPGEYQLAQLQIKNASKEKLQLKLQIANRSFATSTANCKYGQINPDISCFRFDDAGDRLEVDVAPDEVKTVTLRFESKSSEYALNCAKVVIFGGPGHAYQVAVLGVNGQPSLVCLEQNLHDVSQLSVPDARKLRVRNDGEAPAFVGLEGAQATPDLTVINAHGSEDVAVDSAGTELTLKYGNDYLRLIAEGADGRGEWAEMVAQLGVSREGAELLLQECTEVVQVELGKKDPVE